MHARKTVGTKFIGAGALVLLITVAVGLVGQWAVTAVADKMELIVQDPLPGIDHISEIQGLVFNYRGDVWRHLTTVDAAGLATLDAEITQLQRDMETAIADYQSTITRDEDRRRFETTKQQIRAYWQASEPWVQMSRQGRKAEAMDGYVKSCTSQYAALKSGLAGMVQYNRQIGAEDAASGRKTASRARLTMWLLLAAGVVCGAFLLFLVLRDLNRDLRAAAGRLAEGAGRLTDSAGQIGSASQALAGGSAQQAASLQETSASMEQINSMAQRNAENSSSAAQLVASAVERAGAADQLLSRMEGAMAEVHASSGKISKIIKTIDEIAFQTNILALNAAVEAARAGEAGMGFAVVADEVRNLAQRSAQAARDTASLIEESIEKTNGGITMVGQVSEAIRGINGEVVKVKTLVDEVNLGSQEQTTGIEQITRAIGEMGRVTQRNAAGAEQSASAAQTLRSQSTDLRAVVEELEAMVGHGEAARAPKAGKPRTETAGAIADAQKPAAPSRPPLAPPASPTGLKALNRAVTFQDSPPIQARMQAVNAFPLDDNEFEKF